jgi:hypothetical protein
MSLLGHSRFLALSRCALLCAFLLATVISIAHADPENFSGLKDKDLTPKSGDLLDVGGKHNRLGLDDILGKILHGKNKGAISQVHVLSDRADSLTVQVAYSDLKDDADRTLSISATDKKGRPLKAIQTAKTAIKETQGEVTLKMEISPDADPGTTVEQVGLQVQISKGNSLKPEVLAEFECPKQWKSAPSSVVAEPVGKSIGLPATKPAGGIRFRPVTRLGVRPSTAAASDGVAVRQAPTLVASSMKTSPTLARRVIGLPTVVKDNNGRGPGTNYVRLFDGIEMEPGVSDRSLTNLHPNIYEDDNPASGLFYYLPAGYSLYWDPDSGYALRVLYGAAATEDAANNVSIAAKLTTGITSNDVALARTLLQDYCRTNNHVFKELKPFPFSNMAISLKSEVGGQYSIPPEKISVTGITDIAGPIDFSLVTDSVTKENLQLVMTQGLGIGGQVTYQSASDAGAGGLQVTIPLHLKFGDRDSFGDQSYTRGGAIQNQSPFSQKLKFVNFLSDTGTPTVYSYSLADTELPPGRKLTIDAAKIPAWLDSSRRAWIEYSLVSDDPEANRKAWDAITGGVTGAAQSEITFRTLTPLQDTGAALVVVTVSSKYFDPRGGAETTKTLELGKDNESFKIKPIYLVGRQPGEDKPGDPLFKFKLTVVKADGTTAESTQWTNSNGVTVYIGKAQIQPLLGTLPADNKPSTPDADKPPEGDKDKADKDKEDKDKDDKDKADKDKPEGGGA